MTANQEETDEKYSNDTELCEKENHNHDYIAVGEEKDGTSFREKRCEDCGITWKEYEDWRACQLVQPESNQSDADE